MADVSKEELLHIAKLANLNIKAEELDNYLNNLKDILNFANAAANLATTKLGAVPSMPEKDSIEKMIKICQA